MSVGPAERAKARTRLPEPLVTETEQGKTTDKGDAAWCWDGT